MDTNKVILISGITFLIFVFAYAQLVNTFSTDTLPIGNDPDLAFHLNKIQSNPLGIDYPPLFHILTWPFITSTSARGLVIPLIILLFFLIPYALYHVAFEYTKEINIALLSVIFYLFGTGITSNYLYASIWPQALAQVLLLGMLYFILKKRVYYAAFCLLLIAFTHKFFVLYALAIFLVYVQFIAKKYSSSFMPAFYCMQNGKFTQSILCLTDAFIVTVPFFWTFYALKSIVWRTINDKLILIATFLPLLFCFYDIRAILAFGTLQSIYVAKTFTNIRKLYQVITIAILIVFSVATYLYTLGMFS